jgi:hypothetical protein
MSITGFQVKLKCQASGIPPPRVSWRREDQKEIIIREPFHEKSTSSNEKFKGMHIFRYFKIIILFISEVI